MSRKKKHNKFAHRRRRTAVCQLEAVKAALELFGWETTHELARQASRLYGRRIPTPSVNTYRWVCELLENAEKAFSNSDAASVSRLEAVRDYLAGFEPEARDTARSQLFRLVASGVFGEAGQIQSALAQLDNLQMRREPAEKVAVHA